MTFNKDRSTTAVGLVTALAAWLQGQGINYDIQIPDFEFSGTTALLAVGIIAWSWMTNKK